MALIKDRAAPVFDSEQVHKGDLIRAKHKTWDEYKNGLVVGITSNELVVLYHTGIDFTIDPTMSGTVKIAEVQQVRDRERELGLRRTRKKPAWGKAMMAVIYGLCIEIVIYAEIVMWMRFDLSALYALIGVPAAMFGVFWAYAQKSAKENTKGGIVYDMNIRQAETDDPADFEPENSTDTGEGIG